MKKVALCALVLMLVLPAPATAAAEWVELSGTGTYCVAATADGARFLMVEEVGRIGSAPDSRAYIAHADGLEAAELSLVGSAEADIFADMALEWARVHPDRRDATIAESGGKAALSLRLLPWNRARLAEASGDRMLIEIGGVGNLLVDAGTATATLLTGSQATLAADGRAAVAAAGAFSVYDPANAAYATVECADADAWWVMSARLLSDGGFICARRSVKLTALSAEFAFSYVGADGKATESVSAGAYRIGGLPERFYYSEEAGVGIAFNISRILSSPPLIFRKGQPSARALLLDSPGSARARAAALNEALDEEGALKEAGECALLPLGISSDGRRALCLELKSASLLSIDLETLEVKTVLTDAEFRALYEEKNAEYRAILSINMLGWNGGELLAGKTAAPGCALRLG